MTIIEFLETKLQLKGKLTGSGWFQCCCPIHGEKHPSFGVYTRYPYHYHCFSCSSSGQLPQLVWRILKIPYNDAIELVTSMVKVDFKKEFDNLLKKREFRVFPKNLIEIYKGCLRDSPAFDYCLGRGLNAYELDRFNVGYDELTKRMVVPIRNIETGDYVGFDTRGHAGGEIYKHIVLDSGMKNRTIIAPRGYRKRKGVIVVEGFFDAGKTLNWLARNDMAKDYTVVYFGGVNVSDRQVAFLTRYDKIVLGFDDDKAGVTADAKVRKRLEGVRVRNLSFDGKDPGESSFDSMSIT